MDPNALKGAVSLANLLMSKSSADVSAAANKTSPSFVSTLISSLFMPSFNFTSIIFLIILAVLVSRYAKSKGRNAKIWFIYTFVAAYLAILQIIFIKPDERGILHNENRAKCPFCGSHIHVEAKVCPFCLKDLELKFLQVPSGPSEIRTIMIIIVSVVFIIIAKYLEHKAGIMLHGLL